LGIEIECDFWLGEFLEVFGVWDGNGFWRN